MAVIRFDVNTLRPTETGSALGQIWLELGSRAIPSPRWDDFIVFILDWWRRGIQDILTGKQMPTPFAFMEGQYEYSVARTDTGFVFRCAYQQSEIYSLLEDNAGMREFVNSYFAVVKEVLERIEQDTQWRITYLGSSETLDQIKAAQPHMEMLLAAYK